MAQVFGNRILGGIGAPESRAAEAFGAGVNTSITNRANRQAMDVNAQNMAIQQQEMAWKEEDRKIAAQQRAAAAAAAAAAKGKAAALNDAWMRIYGTGGAAATPRVGGLAMPTAAAAPATARDRQGPATTAAPAAPSTARPAGVRVPASPALSFGKGAVAGGAGTTALPGGPGADRMTMPAPVAAAAPRDRQPVDGTAPVRLNNLAAYGVSSRVAPAPAPTPPLAGQVGVMLPSTTGPIPSYVDAPGIWSGVMGDLPGAADAEALYRDGWINEYEYQQLVRGSRGQQDDVLTAAARRQSGTNVPFFVPGQEATAAAPAAAPATPAAAAAAAPATGTVNVTLPDGSKLPLSLGTDTPVAPTQLSFGPQLGATPQTQEDIAVDSFVTARGIDINAPAPPAPPRMGQPGQPNRAITRLMEQRDQQVQWVQALIQAGQYDAAREAQAEIMSIDTKLEASVARLALNEATMFNAPQRLSAVWSDFTGQQYEFQPAANGGLDVYVNGELMDQGLPMERITQETLSMTDQAYAAQQAELALLTAQERAKGMGKAEANIYEYGQKAAIDAQKALRVGLTEIDLAAMKQELGIGVTDNIDLQKDDTTGIILVFKNGSLAAQYRPTTIAPDGGEPTTSYERVQ